MPPGGTNTRELRRGGYSVIGIGSPADNKIMQGIATARNAFHQKQTWLEFINGMVKEKVHVGHDFSKGQPKHLPALIAEPRRGNKLAGCGSLRFVDEATTKSIQ